MTARRRLLIGTLALGVTLIAIFVIGRGRPARAPLILEVEMKATAGAFAQLYWAADSDFVEDRSVRAPLQPSVDGLQRLRFLLPVEGSRGLRFDPIDGPGEVVIGRVRLLDSTARVLATLTADDFWPANQIASMTREGDVMRVITTPAADNPFLRLSLGCLSRPAFPGRLTLVTPIALALANAAALALLAGCVAIIGRAALAGEPRSRRLAALWMTALFLVVFSAKLLLMRGNPVTSPFWDQWDGEASGLFVPYHGCSLTWRTMFSLFNEHRIFFPRLLALDLLVANKQWDPRLEQVANAGIHSLTAVLLATVFWLASGRRRLDLVVFVTALSFALPFGWENTLAGFQSAFYFLLLFSILALWLTTSSRPMTRPWLLGWLCAVCALFTAASGVIVPAAIAGVAVLKLANDRRGWRESVINGAPAALVLALGIAMSSPPLPYIAYLKARSVAVFMTSIGHSLAWPWILDSRLSLVMWLPVCALLAAAAMRRARTTEFERLIVGLAIWVVLHAGALAYGRGGGGPLPQSRYMDFLSLGLVANGLACFSGLDRIRVSGAARRAAVAMLAGWLLFAVVGVDRLTDRAMTDLRSWRQYFAAQAASVRQFMATGELAEFMARPPLYALPYPSAERLAMLLQEPYIRRILPAAIREPVHLDPRSFTAPFVSQRPDAGVPYDPLARAWWSLSSEGRKGQAWFESEPVTCRAGSHLKFQVSGYLGWENQYLAVKELQTGRERAVTPSRLAGEGWSDVAVACPPAAFKIIAVDSSVESWFGFREPVEIGWLSLQAEWLIGISREMLLAALALAFLVNRWR